MITRLVGGIVLGLLFGAIVLIVGTNYLASVERERTEQTRIEWEQRTAQTQIEWDARIEIAQIAADEHRDTSLTFNIFWLIKAGAFALAILTLTLLAVTYGRQYLSEVKPHDQIA